MSFYRNLQETIENTAVTENGMSGYKTTYHPLVDMNFKIASYRHMSDAQIVEDFEKIMAVPEEAEYALRFILMVRDARGGLGERRLFRVCLNALLKHEFENKTQIVHSLVTHFIPLYGRYDDLFVLIGTAYESEVDAFVRATLREDYAKMQANKPISLLAKWMPSENASAAETRELARHFIKVLGATPREYRKMLSALRAYSNVLEVKLSAKEWSEVDYNAVPSKANLKYMNAFLRNDEERRRDFLAKLRLGAKDVHINGGVNFPHEIVHKYMSGRCSVGNYDEALEQLWKALKDMPGLGDTIVVRDGSGSMTSTVGNTSITALDVATALTIYCSERLQGDFKNRFITFSFQAELVDLSKDISLHAKLKTCEEYDDCSNTDLENVFDLILHTAVSHKMKAEEIPSQILIVSDMEFDPSYDSRGWYSNGMNCDSNVINAATRKFHQYGYELPKLIFWNVASRTNTIPCNYNENGVLLVSGFSVNTLKMVLNGNTDPYEAIIAELDSAPYNVIPALHFVDTLHGERKEAKVRQDTMPSFLK